MIAWEASADSGRLVPVAFRMAPTLALPATFLKLDRLQRSMAVPERLTVARFALWFPRINPNPI
jgi:hypothetical protein